MNKFTSALQLLLWLLVSASVSAEPGTASTKPMEAVSPGPEMQRLVAGVKNDLAAKLSIDSKEIEVLRAEFVTWRNSSAGCPKPGTQYLDVLTSGTRILLKANNETYHYHSGGRRPPSLCKSPSPEAPLPYQDGDA